MRLTTLILLPTLLLLLGGCLHRGDKKGWTDRKLAPGWRTIPLAESAAVAAEPRSVSWLDEIVRSASIRAAEELGDDMTTPEEVYTTVIDLRDPRDPRMGSYQGTDSVYPASVIKTCFMVTALDMVARRELVLDQELRDELRAMMERSSNITTNSILDKISNTGYGPRLDDEAFESFRHKRHITHRHMVDIGLPGLYPVMKTFADGTPFYGRDPQFLGQRMPDNFEFSNKMTTDDTARLFYLIWKRAVVSPAASEYMLDLMYRGEGRSGTAFRRILPDGARLYSKSGSTNLDRHDAGIIELADGGVVIIASFAKVRNRGDRHAPQVIERVASLVLEELDNLPGSLDQTTAESAEEGLERLRRAREERNQ
ncbi:MAG: serine hydrolase [Candidatus Sumerlaeia bacterium]|nr:serine hydrolase [Candidatus Sumerlaeia bacterium]